MTRCACRGGRGDTTQTVAQPHLKLDLGDGVERDPASLGPGLTERLVPHKGPSVVGHEADNPARGLLGAAAVVLEHLEAVGEHDLRTKGVCRCTRRRTNATSSTPTAHLRILSKLPEEIRVGCFTRQDVHHGAAEHPKAAQRPSSGMASFAVTLGGAAPHSGHLPNTVSPFGFCPRLPPGHFDQKRKRRSQKLNLRTTQQQKYRHQP